MNHLIIQARMGSSRFPGKVLEKINNKPCLLILMERVSLAKMVDKITIATTKKKIDQDIVNFCKKHNFSFFRGSENDVLKRYYDCANKYKSDTIIRITSDCPLIDPEIVDQMIKLFYEKNVDYAANTIPPKTRKWPDGSDVEVFSKSALKKAFLYAKNEEREHVTFYFWKSKANFKLVQLGNKYNWSQYRYTLDYEEDLVRIKNIISYLNKKKIFGYTKEIIEIIKNDIKEKKLDEKFDFGYGWNKKKKISL
jgi:spore coat polysaccharide biosynthesis protein SpsF